MEPATAELLTDAIKILGPAAIASWATYRASKAQLELKLKQTKSTQEFGARQHLFRYYRERQEQLAKDYAKLRGSLEEGLGFATGLADTLGDKSGLLIQTMAECISTYSAITPSEIEVTARDMEKNGLAETPDYEKLKSYKGRISELKLDRNLESLRKSTFTIVEAYHFLQHCNSKLLQTQMEKLFGRYLQL